MKFLGIIIWALLFFPIFFCTGNQRSSDVTIVGYIFFANGLGRNAIAQLDLMSDSLSMNFINTRPELFSFNDVPQNAQAVLRANKPQQANISILYDALYYHGKPYYQKVPASSIRIAYSMIESSQIPDEWESIINKYFDAVVVPDPFLVDIYLKGGVTKPIFVLPHPIYIEEFLAKPIRTAPHTPFVFGVSCSDFPRKNYDLLIDAFVQEFGNDPEVKLKIHIPANSKAIAKKIKSLGMQNIEYISGFLSSAQYLQFMDSLDCYVLLSKGEGFSVTPREALALGIPCIISDNTAHATICKSGCVYPIKSDIIEKSQDSFFKGHFLNCRKKDVQKAMREVYQNYSSHLTNAHKGRIWVQQYLGKNLKNKYLNLFKPKVVLLGNENSITNEYFMTSDPILYQKYILLTK